MKEQFNPNIQSVSPATGQSKKIWKIVTLVIAGIIILGGVSYGAYYWWQNYRSANLVCTQDAKLCPDGSFVSRSGPNCEFAACPGENKLILSEFERLKITTDGQPRQQKLTLPPDFIDASWGLAKNICEAGNYDISLYANKAILFTAYPISKKYQDEPLDAWVMTSGDKIICVYMAVRKDSKLAPGVFSVNDPNIE